MYLFLKTRKKIRFVGRFRTRIPTLIFCETVWPTGST